MQVHELVELAHFLKAIIDDYNLSQQYQELINAINQAAQNQNPENVHNYLEKIREIHMYAEEKSLSPAQNKLLEDFGAEQILGRVALNRIETIFKENQAHPQGLTAAIKKLVNETNVLDKRAKQLIAVLDPMISNLKIDTGELGENEGRLWLYFSEATSVDTIEELEKAAEEWKEIIHHFSRMPNASADGGRILQIRKYSPLEIELAANVAILVPLAFGIKWVLSRIEYVIKICQEAEKLKQLKIKTKIVDDLYSEAQEQRKQIAEEAANEIKKKFKANNEARNAAQIALNKIIAFIEGGGQLDIDVYEEKSDDESKDENMEVIQLRGIIEGIRKEIKLLPPLIADDETKTKGND